MGYWKKRKLDPSYTSKFAFLINSHHPPENMAATMDYKEAEREMQILTAKGQF